MSKITQKGFTKLIVIVVAFLALICIGYIILSLVFKGPFVPIDKRDVLLPTFNPNATISPSADDKVIEMELNATNEGDIEKDLQELDSDLNSL